MNFADPRTMFKSIVMHKEPNDATNISSRNSSTTVDSAEAAIKETVAPDAASAPDIDAVVNDAATDSDQLNETNSAAEDDADELTEGDAADASTDDTITAESVAHAEAAAYAEAEDAINIEAEVEGAVVNVEAEAEGAINIETEAEGAVVNVEVEAEGAVNIIVEAEGAVNVEAETEVESKLEAGAGAGAEAEAGAEAVGGAGAAAVEEKIVVESVHVNIDTDAMAEVQARSTETEDDSLEITSLDEAAGGIQPTGDEENPTKTVDESVEAIGDNELNTLSIPDELQANAEQSAMAEIVRNSDKMVKHPLQNVWTLWYLENDRSKSWEEMQNEITSFDTVEDFWSLYNHIKPPSEIKLGSDYSLFKRGIRPMWEDAANNNGGRWVITFNKIYKDDLDKLWLDVLLCLIGEVFDHLDQICGAVINIRGKSYKISIWTANGYNEKAVLEIGHKLRDALRLGPQNLLQYQLHKDTMVKQGSNIKSIYSL